MKSWLSILVVIAGLGCATRASNLGHAATSPELAAPAAVEPARAQSNADPSAVEASQRHEDAMQPTGEAAPQTDVASPAVEAARSPADAPPPIALPATRLSVFGTVTTDADGKLSIQRAESIRNAENEMYGWLVWVGSTDESVQWTETLTAPAGTALPRESHLDVSNDGRRAAFTSAMVPDHGFIHSEWRLGANEAPGRYEIEVALPGGRVERFAFTLGDREDACPARKVLLNWWRARHSLAGDPGNRDVSDRVLEAFGTRLARHGFFEASLEEAYWHLIVSAALRSDDRSVAYGHIAMREIADFQGKARRYSTTTNNPTGLIDYGILFESDTNRLDEAARSFADDFAALLTPHVRKSCEDWWSGQRAEEQRLEAIRKELEVEIERVRARRAEHEKQLELQVDP